MTNSSVFNSALLRDVQPWPAPPRCHPPWRRQPRVCGPDHLWHTHNQDSFQQDSLHSLLYGLSLNRALTFSNRNLTDSLNGKNNSFFFFGACDTQIAIQNMFYELKWRMHVSKILCVHTHDLIQISHYWMQEAKLQQHTLQASLKISINHATQPKWLQSSTSYFPFNSM